MGIRASSILSPAGPAAATATAPAATDTLRSDNPSPLAHEAQGASARTSGGGGAAGAVGARSTPPNDSPAAVNNTKGTALLPKRRLSKPRTVDSLRKQLLQDETNTVSPAAKKAPKSGARSERKGKKRGKSTATTVVVDSTAIDRRADRGRKAPAKASGVSLRNNGRPADVLGWETAFSACSRNGSPPSSRRLAARDQPKLRNAAATDVTSSAGTPKKKLPAVPSFRPNDSDTKEGGRGTLNAAPAALASPAASTPRRSSRKPRLSQAVAVESTLQSQQQSPAPTVACSDQPRAASKRKRSLSPPSSPMQASSPLTRTRPPPQSADRKRSFRNDSKTKSKKQTGCCDAGRRGPTIPPTSRRGAAATRSRISAAVGNAGMSPSRDDMLLELQSSSPARVVVGCCPSQNLGFWEGSPNVAGCTLPPCGEEGCLAPASFGFVESGRVDVCERHAAMGMVDLLNTHCGVKECACHHRPSNALSVRSSILWSTLG